MLSMVLCAGFVAVSCIVGREVPKSLSSLVYTLPKKCRFVWTAWLLGTTLTLTPALFDVIPEQYEAVAHAFATSMMFVGITPLIKRDMNNGHTVLGIAAGFFSQVCVAVLCPLMLLFWLPVVCIFFSHLLSLNDRKVEDMALTARVLP